MDLIEQKATDETQLDASMAQTVRVQIPPYFGVRWFGRGGYENALPTIGNPERQAFLHRLRYHPQNTLFQTACMSLIRQITATPYEVSGKRRIKWYQSVLNEADAGRGWASLLSKVLWDYLTLDDGAVIEVIGAGDREKPLAREAVTGIGHLDPLKCYFTDNTDYPVIYQDYYGKLHTLHRTRVIRLVDMPLPLEDVTNTGFCSLSRALAFVQQSITVMTYVGESLNNEPPPGILNIGNLKNINDFKDAFDLYELERRRAQNSVYKPVMKYAQQTEKADIEFVRFSHAPEGFNAEEMIRLEAQGIASALGIDPQDVLPLTSGNFGTSTQAKVLDKKAHGRTLGFLLQEIERQVNRNILPDYIEFQFKHRDEEQLQAQTENAKAQAEIATMIANLGGGGARQTEIAMQYLANTVEALADVILDDDGQVRLYDDDDTPPQAETLTDLDTSEVSVDAQTLQDDTKALGVDIMLSRVYKDAQTGAYDENVPLASYLYAKAIHRLKLPYADALQMLKEHHDGLSVKALNDVQSSFESALMTQLKRALSERVTKATFEQRMTQTLREYARKAFDAGVKDSGVSGYRLTPDDEKWLSRYSAEQRQYIRNVAKVLYADEMLTEDEINAKPQMWWNKSVYRAYLEGVKRTNADPMMQWAMGNTVEHCEDCQRLNGKTYRLSTWLKADILPRGDKISCGGWQCKCRFVKTAQGRETRAPLRI